MPKRRIAVLVTALAAAGATAMPAHAGTPHLNPQLLVAPGLSSGVYADGRYVELPVPLTGPGVTPAQSTVRDDQTGQVKATGCSGLGSLADGSALGSCPATGPGVSVWRFSTGTARPSGLTPGLRPGGLLGRQWVQLIDPTPVPPFDPGLYFNWHTGEQRRALAKDVHLDSPTLTSGPVLVKGSVIQGRDSPQILEPPAAPPPSSLGYFRQLRIRDGKRTRLVRRCHGSSGCGDVTYSHGVVSWQEVGQPFVYRVDTGKTFATRLPDGYKRLAPVTHTAKHLFYTASGRGPTRGTFQVLNFQARIPNR